MQTFTIVLVGLLGLAIGSFLNAVIYRIPRKKLVRKGRSICPHCEAQLKWFHNIPLLSYVMLRGKCAFCKKPIAFRYPLVELVNVLLYLYFFWQFGLTYNFFVFAVLSSVLLAIFFIDLDFQIIPDLITLPGIVLALAVSFLPAGIGIVNALIGMLVGGGSLYLIAMLGDWLFKKESMGGGDIKMAAMLGALLGWQKVLFIFIASAAIGLVASIVLMIFSARLRKDRVVPFGPFLALAALLAVLYGDQLINYYVVTFVTVH